MDVAHLDALSRRVGSRRTVARGLAVLAMGSNLVTGADARKTKKVKICRNGKTRKVAKKKRKKQLKKGATKGACTGCQRCSNNQICRDGACLDCTVRCDGGDPTSCGNALQAALATGGTVVACPGRYRGNFSMGSARLLGAGNGADPSAHTILEGPGTGRVMDVTGTGKAELTSLRITGGKVTTGSGGGVRSSTAPLTLIDCVVDGNEANNGGGGIVVGAALDITRCTISGNRTTVLPGGGIYLTGNDTRVIKDSVITGNRAPNGGGLRSGVGSVLIRGTKISDNIATSGGGGGIFSNGTSMTLDSASSIVGNTASSGPGGIRRDGGSVTLGGAKVEGNSQPQCSAGIDGCPA